MYIHFPTLFKAAKLTLQHGRKHPFHVLFAIASYGAVLTLALLLTILRFFENFFFATGKGWFGPVRRKVPAVMVDLAETLREVAVLLEILRQCNNVRMVLAEMCL